MLHPQEMDGGIRADGEDVFPGSGNPTVNKDQGILKPKKEDEELRKEIELLKIPELLEAKPGVRLEFARTGSHGPSVKKACGGLNVIRDNHCAYIGRPKSARRSGRSSRASSTPATAATA